MNAMAPVAPAAPAGAAGLDALIARIAAADGADDRAAAIDALNAEAFRRLIRHPQTVPGMATALREAAPADILIGQPDFSREDRNANVAPAAATLNVPTGVAAWGRWLAVAGAWNHRVLLWHDPPRTGQPADVVLGQADAGSVIANRGADHPGVATLHWPCGVAVLDGALMVADTCNRRVLIWHDVQRSGQPADVVLGQVAEVQHHHAHIAVCMAENGWPLDGGPVLGIALDGAGLGVDDTVWGGEMLACTYRGFERLGCLKPVALLGGDRAAREPWRNAYAHLMAEMGWPEFAMDFAELPLFGRLSALPRPALDAMFATGCHAPLASSCGRLFDAAAALCGLAWESQDHEGQAAMAFEAAIGHDALHEPDELADPFAVPRLGGKGMPYVEPLGAWRALLGDLLLGTPPGVIAASRGRSWRSRSSCPATGGATGRRR